MRSKACFLIRCRALAAALAGTIMLAPPSGSWAEGTASPGEPRLINPTKPPAILGRGQRLTIPKACLALVGSRKTETACDFVSGLPMYENDVRIPVERVSECPSPIEFEYDDPRDNKVVTDVATPRKGAVYTCGGPIREVRVR